jgi:SagB-type dehydrogenase family enzyme
MLHTSTSGDIYHQATKHSPRSVMMDPNYVDAATQPAVCKRYPQFFRRFPIGGEDPIQTLIRLTHTVTFEKVYREVVYQARVNPSAGALYPTEVYVQIRGIKGWIDGIYHVEPTTDTVTLVYELIDEGLEAYVLPDQQVKGLVFLISCVYYRSSWKYKNRSLRYCFLDGGHHLGAIEASAYLQTQNLQILFDFDKVALNQDLGFENKEFVTACVISGTTREKPVRRLRSPLPFVCGTDYFEANLFIEQGYQATLLPLSPQKPLEQPQFYFNPAKFTETILNRRSARRFKQKALTQADLSQILQTLAQPIPTTAFESIEIYWVIHRVQGMEPGLYKEAQLLKSGDFSEKTGYLCINQAIARDSAVVFFFASNYKNYQTAVQLAGFLGQRIYLSSDYLGLGCSGIGAYYDDEVQAFLNTDRDILYVMAVGL